MSADADSVLDESINLANGIQRALYEFDSTSNHALLRLYRGVDASAAGSRASMASADDNPNPFLSGSDSEHVFLVYLYVKLLPSFLSCPSLFSLADGRRSLPRPRQLYIHDAGVRTRAHFANGRVVPDLCGRTPQRFQQMVFAHLFRPIERALLLLPSPRKEDEGGAAEEATERPTPENMYDRLSSFR